MTDAMTHADRFERLARHHGPPPSLDNVTGRAWRWTTTALANGKPVTPLTLAEGARLTCGGAAHLLTAWARQGHLNVRPTTDRNTPYAITYTAATDAAAPGPAADTRSPMPCPEPLDRDHATTPAPPATDNQAQASTAPAPGDWRVLVTGSRTWDDPQAVTARLDVLRAEHGAALVIVHGACPRGADAIAATWATRTGTRTEAHPADWTAGKAAGPARNAAMTAAGADLCLAFIRDNSPGATDCARRAEAAGIPTHRITPATGHGDRQHSREQGPEQGHSGALRADHATATRPGGGGAVTDPRLAPALQYAADGLPVFLLGRTKRPVANCRDCAQAGPDHDRQACGCLTCHGFYAATCDPDRIRAMLAAIPRGLLALRTGAVTGLLPGATSDRVVLDIDPRDGGRLDPQIMTPTAVVAAGGADGGWHLHYRHPSGYVPSRKLPGHPGVDVKGDGGYVVLPPSAHPATRRAYRWLGHRELREMHPALAELARAISCPAPPEPSPGRDAASTRRHPAASGAGCISSPDALLAAHLAAVASAPVGRRRRTLYGAARGIARMVAAQALTPQRAWNELTTAGHAAGQTALQTRNAILGAFTDEGVPITPPDTARGAA